MYDFKEGDKVKHKYKNYEAIIDRIIPAGKAFVRIYGGGCDWPYLGELEPLNGRTDKDKQKKTDLRFLG